jgi:hypothetical protein
VDEKFPQEVGLLRRIAANLQRALIPVDPSVEAYFRTHGLEVPKTPPSWKTDILPPGRESFNELSECIVARFPAMERGMKFASFQSELFKVLEDFVGRPLDSISHDDARRVIDQLTAWFARVAQPDRLFIPCVISPWLAPRFYIGPVSFIHIDDAALTEFCSAGENADPLDRRSFDTMLTWMRENNSHFLARVTVKGCEQERAVEVAEFGIDLAIVALQLAAPNLTTRTMCRADTRRGAAHKHTISQVSGHSRTSWTRKEPGISIGAGTLADILAKTEPLMGAVGEFTAGFVSGTFRLPRLEQGWCDAAYWFHEALAEVVDNIAVTKLETALEVLCHAKSAKLSTERVLTVLRCFFNLKPENPIAPGSKLTTRQFAKNLVEDRSRILHGTWSTLSKRLGSSRQGLEGFVATVLRMAAIKLDDYARTDAPADDIDAFLKWLER